jgi:hypothetical protein
VSVTIKDLKRLGYYVREGAYQCTTDNRLGRYYVGHIDYCFAPHGAGYATKRGAWESALEIAHLRGEV